MSDCSKSSPTDAMQKTLPEISVNGALIDSTRYAEELQYHPAGTFSQAAQEAGHALVIRELLLNEISGDVSDEEAAIAELVEKHSVTDEPTEEDCCRYFEQNHERFKTETLMEADHILLAAAKDDLEGRSLAKDQANELIQQLKEKPENFAQLAQQYSVCPSKETGGSLGQIGKGQTVPEFEKQIVRLAEGLAEQAVESRYGFHVVKINRKIDGKPLEYPMVAEKIKHYLTQKASQLSIQAYIHSLVEKADIQGIHIGFSDENIVV